jgi:hypothetical protein
MIQAVGMAQVVDHLPSKFEFKFYEASVLD